MLCERRIVRDEVAEEQSCGGTAGRERHPMRTKGWILEYKVKHELR